MDKAQKDLNENISELRTEMNFKFDELRTDMNSEFSNVRTEMNFKFDKVDERFDRTDKRLSSMEDTSRRQGVTIMLQHDKIMAALDGITSMLGQKDVVKNHEERIVVLERDVDVVKTIIKNEPRA